MSQAKWIEDIKNGCNEFQNKAKNNASWTLNDWVELKKHVSSQINNLIVEEQANLFLNILQERKIITEKEKISLLDKMPNPNAPGFDFYDKNKKIVAEMKGTVPCEDGGKKFGATQAKNIKKDLDGLSDHNKKGKGAKDTPLNNEFKRYMVLLACSKDAMESMLESARKYKFYKTQSFVEVTNDDGTKVKIEIVYV